MMNLGYENIKQFCEKFNRLRNSGDLSITEDRQFMNYWQTELAMAIMKDLDNSDLVKDIAKIMLFLCEYSE